MHWVDAGAYFCAQSYRGTSLPLRGNDRPGSPQGCPVASRHSARGSGGEGANQKNVPLEQVPLAPQYPFERPAGGLLQVPERLKENWEFRGFASPGIPPHSPLLPRRGGRPRAAPRKGFLNRRFKRVFGYFCRGAKVTAGRPGPRRPRAKVQITSSRYRPTRRTS